MSRSRVRFERQDPAAPPRLRPLVLLAVIALGLVLVLVAPQAASADTAPASGVPATVSSDVLPTVQVDGVVWAQVVVGNTVYAAGRFSQARPAGVAAGATGSGGRVARADMLAYDIRTGVLISTFAPQFNSEVRSIAVGDGGKTIYAVGNFTTVNGKQHTRIAAIDATTGKALSFAGSLNSIGLAVAVHGTTVYVGGQFTSASGSARARLAAFDSRTGALTTWSPSADRAVQAVAVSPDGSSVVVAGYFSSVDGAAAPGSARVDATSGRTMLRWTVNSVVRNSGANAAIYSLSSNGTDVFMSGYAASGGAGRLEGVAAVSWATGKAVWIEDCQGDTYATAPVGGVLYTAGDATDCSTVHAYGATSQPARALAFTTSATQTLLAPSSKRTASFRGQAAPSMLTWFPTFTTGSYTGLGQAAWSVAGTTQYVVYGGEFPAVNGVAQQGLVRFAVAGLAPDADGPRLSGDDLKPTLKASGDRVTGSVRADWDRDNEYLTYRVYRDPGDGATLADLTPVVTVTRASEGPWTRPIVTFTDDDVPSGTHTYVIVAVDPSGNTATGSAATVTVSSAAAR